MTRLKLPGASFGTFGCLWPGSGKRQLPSFLPACGVKTILRYGLENRFMRRDSEKGEESTIWCKFIQMFTYFPENIKNWTNLRILWAPCIHRTSWQSCENHWIKNTEPYLYIMCYIYIQWGQRAELKSTWRLWQFVSFTLHARVQTAELIEGRDFKTITSTCQKRRGLAGPRSTALAGVRQDVIPSFPWIKVGANTEIPIGEERIRRTPPGLSTVALSRRADTVTQRFSNKSWKRKHKRTLSYSSLTFCSLDYYNYYYWQVNASLIESHPSSSEVQCFQFPFPVVWFDATSLQLSHHWFYSVSIRLRQRSSTLKWSSSAACGGRSAPDERIRATCKERRTCMDILFYPCSRQQQCLQSE